MLRIKYRYWLAYFVAFASVIPAGAQQDNPGTSFGIPNSSPGTFWPRGSSIETLGFGRLYPNGPEFGLSNTSGGFGSSGSARLSGIGLAERSVQNFVREQTERPYTNIQRLTDAFSHESSSSAILFSTALSGQFRTEIHRGSIGQKFAVNEPEQLTPLYALPSVDTILQDRTPSTDSVLKTGL